METFNYSIDSKKRHKLSLSHRILYNVYGLFLITFQILLISKNSNLVLSVVIIALGVTPILYGIIGKELLVTHDYLIMDQNNIKIKRSFDVACKIKLSSITYIKFIPEEFEITFKDYVKDYDLSWITIEEFQMLKVKLQEYCRLNNIRIE
jgi:hypothetical protein